MLGSEYLRLPDRLTAVVEPVVATIIGAWIFAEPIGVPFGYIGVGLVFLSVVLINIKIPKKNNKT